MRACWNRQTGKLEVLVSVRSCGFKSHRSHQKIRDTRRCVSYFSARRFFCAEPVTCGRLFVPDLTFGEHIEMGEHIFFYMGETQERCVFCWLDAPVSK